jgi:CheY-specific phosphatase CheX
MSNAEVQLALEQAATDVLEKMFFLSALPAPSPETAPAGAIQAQLTFDGDPPGRFTMLLSSAAAATIAANFLGDDPAALGPQQVADVAAELANMICGAVLSRVESTAVFHLATPQVLPGSAELWPPGPAGAPACTLDTGDGTLTVTLETESPVCPA